MKQINLKSHLFRPLVALFSLFVLQAFYIDFNSCMRAKKEQGYKRPNDFQALLPKSISPSLQSFHYAVDGGDLEKVKGILNRIENLEEKGKKIFLNSLSDGTTALGKAIEKGDEPMVRLLIGSEYIDINKTGRAVSSLLLALKCNQPKIAQILLTKSGYKVPDVTDSDLALGNTLLHILVKGRSVGAVTVLLGTNFVDVNAQNKAGDTPLHIAVRSGYADVVNVLLQVRDIDVNVKDKDENALLHLATKKGVLGVVKAFLEAPENNRIDLNVQNINKNTPLHLAAEQGHLAVVDFLVKKGGDPNVKNVNENTPLHLAAEGGHLDVVKFLVEKGGNPNAQNINKNTPLHLAAEQGHLAVVQFLLEQPNSNPNAQNINKNTPLDLAKQKNHQDCIKALQKFIDSESLKNK